MKENMEIPKEWGIVTLGEVCKLKNGFAFKSTYYKDQGIPVIRISDIKEGAVNPDNSVRIDEKKDYDDYIIHQDEILVAMSGATTGKFGIFKSKEKAYQNQRVGKFQILTKEQLDNNFLLHQLHSLKRQIEKDAYGGAQPNISSTKIEEMQIVLPPLPEQHRIVAKIEALFSSLEKGIESLKTAQQQLKVYRQAVLKWAFDGKLTNENVKDGELPDRWKWVKLGDVSEMCLGKMLDKEKNKGSYQPYLRNINVRWGAFDLSALEDMRFEENEEERYSLKKGDLIICEGGEPGRCAVWNYASQNMKIQKALHRVRVNKSLSEKFVFHYMFYSATNGLLEKYFTGTTIKHLTGRELKKIQFPLPPLPKQQAIVSEIESRLSVCDKLEENITCSLKQAEALRQSILKKAFEGKLVPQDPNDEPANALLERIKAEKEKNQPEKKVKMKKAKS